MLTFICDTTTSCLCRHNQTCTHGGTENALNAHETTRQYCSDYLQNLNYSSIYDFEDVL